MTEPQYTSAPHCIAPGCTNPPRGKRSLCSMHASRFRRHKSFDVPQLTDDQRFDAKVLRGEGCWTWLPARNRGRHGNFSVWRDGKAYTVLAHRYAYERANGPITDDLWVLHKCDNPICVRPDHLYLGTPLQNTGDALARGRFALGERHGRVRLNENQVHQIRKLRQVEGLACAEIAAQFSVSKSTVQRACAGLTWRHVEMPT